MVLDDFLIEAGRHGLYAIDYDPDDFRREINAIVPAAAAHPSAACRVAAWIAEDAGSGVGDRELLKAEIDRDRPSFRKLFPG